MSVRLRGLSPQWEQRSGWDLEPLSRCCRHTSLSGRQIIDGCLPTSRLATFVESAPASDTVVSGDLRRVAASQSGA